THDVDVADQFRESGFYGEREREVRERADGGDSQVLAVLMGRIDHEFGSMSVDRFDGRFGEISPDNALAVDLLGRRERPDEGPAATPCDRNTSFVPEFEDRERVVCGVFDGSVATDGRKPHDLDVGMAER